MFISYLEFWEKMLFAVSLLEWLCMDYAAIERVGVGRKNGELFISTGKTMGDFIRMCTCL